MNQYKAGAKLFCDFHFGGKPKAVCVEVIEPGRGHILEGKIKVRLTETTETYKKGEELVINSVQAVPIKQAFKKRGSVFRYVNTQYEWVK